MSWSYDGFGNRLAQNLTKGTGPTNSTLVDANTNRISGFGYQYDQNGNMTNMPQQNAQMQYDGNNRMVHFQNSNDWESYRYAPDNKRIWRSKGCSYYNWATGIPEPRPQIIFYSAFGQKLGEYCLMDNVTVLQEFLYFGGRMVAKGNGTLQSFKTDRLHSNQDAPGGGFFPYGETKSGAATTGDSFATYSRDWHGLDYADQRWYSSQTGSFSSPDPSEHRFARLQTPSSWNRFSYVEGDPTNKFDPRGLSHLGDSLMAPPDMGPIGGGGYWLDVWGLYPWEMFWVPNDPPIPLPMPTGAEGISHIGNSALDESQLVFDSVTYGDLSALFDSMQSAGIMSLLGPAPSGGGTIFRIGTVLVRVAAASPGGPVVMTVVGLAAVGYIAYEIYNHKKEQNDIKNAIEEVMSECVAEGKKLKFPDYESVRIFVGEEIHPEKEARGMKSSDTFSWKDLKKLVKEWICE